MRIAAIGQFEMLARLHVIVRAARQVLGTVELLGYDG